MPLLALEKASLFFIALATYILITSHKLEVIRMYSLGSKLFAFRRKIGFL